MRGRALTLTFAVVVAQLACGDTGGGSGDTDGGGSGADAGPRADAAPMPAGAPLGRVWVQELLGDGAATTGYLAAQLGAGAAPRWQTRTLQDGDCALWEFQRGTCSGPCNGVCVADQCLPWPSYQSAGPLSIGGISAPQTLTPSSNGAYYPAAPPPADLFTPGAEVTASAAGADLPAFATSARAVAPITIPFDAPRQRIFDDGVDEVLTWTPAGDGSTVAVTINSPSAGGHGQPLAAIIECTAPDTAGQITIPAAMVTAFPDSTGLPLCVGIDCPPSSIERRTTGYAPLPGGYVTLEVAARLYFQVKHDRGPPGP